MERFLASAGLLLFLIGLFLVSSWIANAFTGPTASPPTGGGAIQVDSANNVGIGTATPGAKLDLQGALNIRSSSQPADPPADQGRVYYNATEDVFKVYENAAKGWVNLVSASSVSAGNVSAGSFGSLVGGGIYSFPDRVGIGTASPNSSAILDLVSTNKGFLAPRMTTTQRNSVSGPAVGLMIYNTTLNQFEYWNGSWIAIGGAGGNATYAP